MADKPEEAQPAGADPKQAEPLAGRSVSDNEIAAARSNPAFFVNRVVASNTLNGMRFAFGENYGPDTVTTFRFSIHMSYEDAAAVRDLIESQLALLIFAQGNPTGGDSGPDTK